MTLNPHKSVSLYLQLAELLRQEITNGRYRSGEKFPTEQELSQLHKVSRVTVRNALAMLENEKLLERKQGKGTFVTSEKFSRSLSDIVSFSDICIENGKTPGTKVIKCMLEPATPDDIKEFGLAENAHVMVLDRIRYADGIPVSIEYSRFPESLSFLLQEDMNNTSLLNLLRSKYGIIISKCHKTIELAYASYDVAHYLNIPENYPLISVLSYSTLSDGMLIHRNLQLILGDKFKFYV